MSGGTLKAKMRRVLLAAGVAAAALSISACVPAVTAGTQAGTALPWEVRFELSGGIAGMVKQVTVFHDGRVVAEDLRRRSRVEKRLSAGQLLDLHRLVEQAESAPEMAVDSLSRCADCTQYRLAVTGSEGRPRVSERGAIELQQSGSPELIKFLSRILNETIQP
jgi:hypothetical protein